MASKGGSDDSRKVVYVESHKQYDCVIGTLFTGGTQQATVVLSDGTRAVANGNTDDQAISSALTKAHRK